MTEAEEEVATSSTVLTAGAIFLGPPVAAGGRVYVAYEKRGQLRVACIDPASVALSPGPRPVYEPRLIWTQLIGEPSSPAATDPLRRTQAAYLAIADGILVCPTNAGTVVALDLNAQRLLWARNYNTATAEEPDDPNNPGGLRGGRRFGRGGVMPPKPVPTDRWRAAAPIISDGTVVVAAYDADQAMALDLRTGAPLWSVPRGPDDVAVGGVVNSTVVFVGRKQLRGYALGGEGGKPKQLWSVPVGTPLGQGATGRDGVFYLPVLAQSKVEQPAAKVVAVDVGTGALKPGVAFRRRTSPGEDPRTDLGNLVFADGLMISQSCDEIAAFPLVEPMRKVMEARLKANPNDPAAIVTQAELRLQDGDYAAAAADLRKARAFDPSDAVARRLRQKLYTAYSELARKDFPAAEPFLDDYAALCEVPSDSADPAERRRQLDEGAARKGLYLVQVATGREKQKMYAEAFDAYRAYAAASDGSLADIAGDASAQIRPDRWARGRIERMAAGNVTARAIVAAKIRAEWARVKSSKEANEIRPFVELFGGFGEAGRESQLALADALIAVANPPALAEAHEVLTRAAATTDDPAHAARCLDRVAKLAAEQGDPDTAVATYLKLAADYPEVDLGGKTAHARAAEALSDRRLLPSLDPGSVAPPAAYKVRPGTASRVSPSCELVLDGELAPGYRRLDLVAEFVPQDQSVVVRAVDRVTGEERAKFTGIGAASAQGVAVRRRGVVTRTGTFTLSALADGSRLLLVYGNVAHCLDLATGREAWRLDLLGKGQVAAQVTEDDAGQSTDGFSFRLRRAAILTPQYAAFVTLEGLRVVDPATGRDLWTRSDVARTASVFGDARHVLVADATTSRALRSLDGSAIEGVPDFAAKVHGSSRMALLGRTVLSSERLKGRRVFSLYDPIAGKTVWTRDYPLTGSAVIQTLDPKITGILLADGKFELFGTADGRPIAAGTADAEVMRGSERATLEPFALLDAERVYLFVSRGGPNEGVTFVYRNANAPAPRGMPVNGPVVAFDRATGKRLWYNLDSLTAQRLIVERFDEVPALVAAGATRDPETNSARMKIVLIDKRTGRLRYDVKQNQLSDFVSVSTDPRTRAVELVRNDLTIRLTPTEGPNP